MTFGTSLVCVISCVKKGTANIWGTILKSGGKQTSLCRSALNHIQEVFVWCWRYITESHNIEQHSVQRNNNGRQQRESESGKRSSKLWSLKSVNPKPNQRYELERSSKIFLTKCYFFNVYISRPTRCTDSYNASLFIVKCSTCFGLFSPSSGATFWSCISQMV